MFSVINNLDKDLVLFWVKCWCYKQSRYNVNVINNLGKLCYYIIKKQNQVVTQFIKMD
jgi:hypothetical protein